MSLALRSISVALLRILGEENGGPGRIVQRQSAGFRSYLGGCSSPFIQPVTLSLFMGSGRSQAEHWNVRRPFPPRVSVKIKLAPHLVQVGRSACPMAGNFAARRARRPFQK